MGVRAGQGKKRSLVSAPMTLRLLLIPALAACLCLTPTADAAVKHTAHATAKKTPHKSTTKKKNEDDKAKIEAALRENTDRFVAQIDAGKQSLTDAQIAWNAKHPEVACQRAKSAKARFITARGILGDMVKAAQGGKADSAPFKALYPKIDELDDTTHKLIGMTCTD